MTTGVSGVPNLPDLPGLDEFGGEVLHSSGYGAGTDHAGRRALVVGTGNSGHDVAQDLYSYGAAVTMVQRSPTTVVHSDPTAQKVYALYAEGMPTDDADLVLTASPYPVAVRSFQIATEQMKVDDAELLSGLDAIGFRRDWGTDGTGFQMKYWRRGGGYYLNVGCSELLIDGEIGLVQWADVDRFVPDGVRLRSGATVPVDLVVLATGYEPQIELVRRSFGEDVAGRVGQVWGIDDEGELAGMWKRSGQPGLWFHAGSLAQNRIFSRFLALQIIAVDEGLIDPAPPARLS
jgi:putative flavoprotein involved in K+ transport